MLSFLLIEFMFKFPSKVQLFNYKMLTSFLFLFLRRYGQGHWKHILSSNSDCFSGRTSVSFRDKIEDFCLLTFLCPMTGCIF